MKLKVYNQESISGKKIRWLVDGSIFYRVYTNVGGFAELERSTSKLRTPATIIKIDKNKKAQKVPPWLIAPLNGAVCTKAADLVITRGGFAIGCKAIAGRYPKAAWFRF